MTDGLPHRRRDTTAVPRPVTTAVPRLGMTTALHLVMIARRRRPGIITDYARLD
jgi:hypothetical protein